MTQFVIIAESGASVAGPFADEAAARTWAAEEGVTLDGESGWVLPLLSPSGQVTVEVV
jgi:hypothetical protein